MYRNYAGRRPRHRATATGNMHKNFGKDLACSSGDNYHRGQTDTQTILAHPLVLTVAKQKLHAANLNLKVTATA